MSEFENKVLESLGEIKGEMKGINKELQDNKNDHAVIFDRLDRNGKDIARVQVKSGLYGSVSGAIGGALASIVKP